MTDCTSGRYTIQALRKCLLGEVVRKPTPLGVATNTGWDRSGHRRASAKDAEDCAC
jgi:hypothetical protein